MGVTGLPFKRRNDINFFCGKYLFMYLVLSDMTFNLVGAIFIYSLYLYCNQNRCVMFLSTENFQRFVYSLNIVR